MFKSSPGQGTELLVPFDDVRMKCRGDPTIVAGACELWPSGPLAGGDGVLMGSH